MNSTFRRSSVALAAVASLAILIEAAEPQATLGVPGFVNATPSLSVLGRSVAAVWTAARGSAVNVYLATSADGGATFSEPRRVNDQDGDASANNEQPPRVVLSGTAARPVLTVMWSKRSDPTQKSRQDVIRIAQSSDGGRTFSASRSIHDASLSGARGWHSLTAGPNGTLHSVWLDGRDAAKKTAEAMTHAAHTGAMPPKGQPPQDVYHGVIGPDGRMTQTRIASDVCFCCKTAVAVDGRGGVYAAWRHIFPGSMRDMAFARSTDGGASFTPLVRVSVDNWELNGCPEDGPAMTVEPSGTIHIVWPTLVKEGESQKALFYATSRDGQTFSARVRVPTAGITNPSHPHLTPLPDGGLVVVWDETMAGVRRVVMSRMARGGGFGKPEVLSAGESAFYPAVARVSDNGLLVAWTNRVSPEESMIGLKRVMVAN